MKKILLSLFTCLLLNIPTFGQDSECYAREVVETGLSKDVMWKNLQSWVANTFNSPQNVVEVEDKEAGLMTIKFEGMLSGKNVTIKNGAIELKAKITLQIEIKDNKYRYTFPFGSVVVSPGWVDNNRFAISVLKTHIADMEFCIEVAQTYFNGEPTWEVNNRFDQIIKTYEEALSLIPKTNKRGKINPEWSDANSHILLLNDVKNGCNAIIESTLVSLVGKMNIDDDF